MRANKSDEYETVYEPDAVAAPTQSDDPRAISFRTQLGIPHDRAIVLTGHQCGLFHPGILAKYAAAEAIAQEHNTAACRLWVDTDDSDPLTIDVPTRADGRLHKSAWRIAPDVEVPPGTPTGYRAPIKSVAEPPAGIAGVRAGAADAVREAVLARKDAPSLAAQFAGACTEFMPDDARADDAEVFESALSRTELFAEVVESMRADPVGCAEAYNDAVAQVPDAGVRPLRVTAKPEQTELPLWRARWGEPRMPMRASMLEGAPVHELAPRALLMTGLMRAFGCDLFIHGTGGGSYDRVTERWMRTWMGVALAPMLVVSASVRLDLVDGEPVREEDASAARQRARRARSEPSLLGDEETAARKRELLEQIENAKKAREKPAAHFAALKALLADYESRHAPALAAMESEAETLAGRAADWVVARERSWAICLHEPKRLDGLVRAVGSRARTSGVTA